MIFDSPVYPIPPSFSNGLLDVESSISYMEYLFSKGAKTVMTTAGTSQYNLLSPEEIRLLNLSLLNFPGKKIIGIPALSEKHTLQEIRSYSSEIGNRRDVYFLLLFPERYYSDDQLFSFFTSVISESPYPVLIHGNPIKRGNGGQYEYKRDILESLSLNEKFVGIKEESSTIDFSIKSVATNKFEMIVAGGSMRRFWCLEPFGASTYLAGVGSFNPIIEEDFYRCYQEGSFQWAKDIMSSIETPLFSTFMEIGWHASMRYSLEKMGYIKGNRSPFYVLNAEEKIRIESALEKIL